MKRYKQAILSNYFVAQIDSQPGSSHLVEANLDIESRADRTLCTEVLHGAYRYDVLTNNLLLDTCPICTAILDRRISNMPKERKANGAHPENVDQEVPESQMSLLFSAFMEKECRKKEERESKTVSEPSPQFELFG